MVKKSIIADNKNALIILNRVILLAVFSFCVTIPTKTQEVTNRKKNNLILLEVMLFNRSLKSNYRFEIYRRGLLINYNRIILRKNNLTLSGEIGFGIKNRLGETSNFIIPINLFTKLFIGKNKNSFVTGLGYTYLDDGFLVVPLGYRLLISDKFSFIFTYNQIIWENIDDFDGTNSIKYSDWFWNSDYISHYVNFGFYYTF
ncbi:MAG: hypothetical protein H8D45_22740 [Bacteroidetes bacterium]|nr:hypothetical protein [Bacteroidota bacterium]